MLKTISKSICTIFPKNIGLNLSILLWILLIILSLGLLINYETKPALLTDAVKYWPSLTQFIQKNNTYKLVMVVHPYCSCSRASLRELSLIMARIHEAPVSTYLLFYRSKASAVAWTKSRLWEKALQLENVQLIDDADGKLSKLFNASISGQTLLYEPSGRLVFNGGITPSRGHEGDNSGINAIVAIITKGITKTHKTFVYGCPIFIHNSRGKNRA